MNYRYKNKRKRLKPAPVILLLIILALIIFFVVKLSNKGENVPLQSQISSIENSSDIEQEIKPLSSDESSNAISSEEESSTETSSEEPSSSKKTSSTIKTDGSDPYVLAVGGAGNWNLILLNRTNSLSKDLSISKKQFGSQWIDARIAPAYKAMCDDAKKDDITLFLRSGYRSISAQRVNYEADINRNITKGYTREQATIETQKYYAIPGQSEHHTGLALDIITPEYHNEEYTLSERFADTKAYDWLVEHCADYGFILRYPKGKEGITKINYEPWHYRYVGVKHAKYMMENNITLEEYLD